MTHPIILAHGIARFDVLLLTNGSTLVEELGYWKDIPQVLQKDGHRVHRTNVSWAGSVAKRASELAQQIRAYLADQHESKVNIIAHSMGGLDARHAIVKLGLGRFVASLTTLSTPHRGSAFADWGVAEGLVETVTGIVKPLGIDVQGLKDLTTQACEKRNEEFQEFEEANKDDVLYQTYAGTQDIWDIFWPLVPSYRIIDREQGKNDGLVSVSSAKWKSDVYKGVRNFDHLNWLGWWDPAEWDVMGGRQQKEFEQEIHEFYLAVARELP